MTDHADTIRPGRTITVNGQNYVLIDERTTIAGRTAKQWLDVEAELRQAQEDVEVWKASTHKAADRIEQLSNERRLAIDALREIAHTLSCSSPLVTQNIARAALAQLGEATP